MNRRRFIALLAALPLVRYFRRPPGRKYEWVMGPIITQAGNRDHNVESVNGKLEFIASGPMQRVAYGQLLTVDDRGNRKIINWAKAVPADEQKAREVVARFEKMYPRSLFHQEGFVYHLGTAPRPEKPSEFERGIITDGERIDQSAFES